MLTWVWRGASQCMPGSERAHPGACLGLEGPSQVHAWVWSGTSRCMPGSGGAQPGTCLGLEGHILMHAWVWRGPAVMLRCLSARVLIGTMWPLALGHN